MVSLSTEPASHADDDQPPPIPVKQRNTSLLIDDRYLLGGSNASDRHSASSISPGGAMPQPISPGSLRQSSDSFGSACSASSDEICCDGSEAPPSVVDAPPPKPPRSPSTRLLETRLSQYDNVDGAAPPPVKPAAGLSSLSLGTPHWFNNDFEQIQQMMTFATSAMEFHHSSLLPHRNTQPLAGFDGFGGTAMGAAGGVGFPGFLQAPLRSLPDDLCAGNSLRPAGFPQMTTSRSASPFITENYRSDGISAMPFVAKSYRSVTAATMMQGQAGADRAAVFQDQRFATATRMFASSSMSSGYSSNGGDVCAQDAPPLPPKQRHGESKRDFEI